MSDDIEFSDEFVENFLDNVFELWFNDALEEKGIEREDFEKGQVLLKNPFALSQFEDLKSDDSDVEVHVNDDAGVVLQVEIDSDRDIEAGDPIYAHEVEGFEEVILDEDQDDYGHVTVADMGQFGWYINFDFRYNRSYQGPLIDAADEFIDMAEYAKENEKWRAFVENCFHAAERMMKIDVIFMGWSAETHADVQARYSDLVDMGIGNPELYDVFNQLKGKYRFSASYVDPRGDVDERDFDFDEEEAEEFLSVIKKHREHLEEESDGE